jgi:hypothetical protein
MMMNTELIRIYGTHGHILKHRKNSNKWSNATSQNPRKTRKKLNPKQVEGEK